MDAVEGSGTVTVTNADYLAAPLRLDATEAAALVGRGAGHCGRPFPRLTGTPSTGCWRNWRRSWSPSRPPEPHAFPAPPAPVLLPRRRTPTLPAGERATSGYRWRFRWNPTPTPLSFTRCTGACVTVADCTCATPARPAMRSPNATSTPRQLVTAAGRTYLDAWCHRAEGNRLFLLGRILSATVRDEPAVPPTDRARERPLRAGPGLPAVCRRPGRHAARQSGGPVGRRVLPGQFRRRAARRRPADPDPGRRPPVPATTGCSGSDPTVECWTHRSWPRMWPSRPAPALAAY